MPEPTHPAGRHPLVGIGLPVYNGGQLLGGAIGSLLAQDYPNFELVISDNASTDQTPRVCEDFARLDGRVRYHRSDVNRGASWNFNRVFALSRGEYFMWAAHDDLWGPGCVRLCVEALEADHGAALCHPSSQPIDPSGRPVGGPYLGDAFVNDAGTVRGRWRAAVRKPSLHAAVYGVFRRSALEKTRLFQVCVGADAVLVAEVSLHGRVINLPRPLSSKRVPDPLAGYRSHEEMLGYMGQAVPKAVNFPRLAIVRELLRSLAASALPGGQRGGLVADTLVSYVSCGSLAADLKYCLIRRVGMSRYQRWSRALRPWRRAGRVA